MNDSQPALIHVYTVRLLEIEPAIWRRIEVSEDYSFWDLHVAIQDAMGWLDYHLHEFQIFDPRRSAQVRLGISDEEDYLEPPTKDGWRVKITRYFKRPGNRARYIYDFGDNWQHDVQLTAIALAEPGVTYPRCTDGARACPPEDCGGPGGYHELVRILADSKHPERRSMNTWLRGHVKNYYPYRPEQFEPGEVEFMNPAERFRMMMEG